MAISSKPKADAKKQPEPPDPIKEKLKGKIKAKVDRLDSLTDVLTGKELPSGKVGEQLRALQLIDKNADGLSKARRDKKYKKFDEWLVRQQFLNNVRDGAGGEVPYVRLRRSIQITTDNKGNRKVV